WQYNWAALRRIPSSPLCRVRHKPKPIAGRVGSCAVRLGAADDDLGDKWRDEPGPRWSHTLGGRSLGVVRLVGRGQHGRAVDSTGPSHLVCKPAPRLAENQTA